MTPIKEIEFKIPSQYPGGIPNGLLIRFPGTTSSSWGLEPTSECDEQGADPHKFSPISLVVRCPHGN